MFLLFQLPTDPPMSFTALQWVMVGMLTAALIYVFRQWQSEKKNCTQRYIDTIDKLMAALHERIDDDEFMS
jgi:hypothetical protein